MRGNSTSLRSNRNHRRGNTEVRMFADRGLGVNPAGTWGKTPRQARMPHKLRCTPRPKTHTTNESMFHLAGNYAAGNGAHETKPMSTCMWRWGRGNRRVNARERAMIVSTTVCGSSPRRTKARATMEACKNASNHNARIQTDAASASTASTSSASP